MQYNHRILFLNLMPVVQKATTLL